MQCAPCQHENPPQAKFCMECGAPCRADLVRVVPFG
jgi:hypothetical protein